ncbi:hypothetical protein QD98_000460 [Salmonella enterica subsp. enterica]|nr:hypothetical protein [Salmonella enterica subsp. enterica]EDU9522599.1 hypothetical protein [Salmonella enterica subsp. enterica]EDW1427633.1 hypothetical protein [Salmonella enterica subsp. enterica]EGI5879372.1 hypothetical protein [Salmonella enterica subsp. enterica serovar Brunei]
MTPDLYRAIQNRDGEMLARMAGDSYEGRKVVNADAEKLVDMLFENLMQVFPASTQTNLRTGDDIRVAKQQWIAAFAESGIGGHEHTMYIGPHGHVVIVDADGNAETTVKNIAFNYIVRLA